MSIQARVSRSFLVVAFCLSHACRSATVVVSPTARCGNGIVESSNGEECDGATGCGDDCRWLPFLLRLDAGSGDATTSYGGRLFVPAAPYAVTSLEALDESALEIGNTEFDGLYRSQHWPAIGNMTFRVPVLDGAYRVHLHNAETTSDATGFRIFTVVINGVVVIANWEVAAEAGGLNVAVRRSVDVVVDGGELEIVFERSGGNPPKICGIEILPPTQPPLPLISDANPCAAVSVCATGDSCCPPTCTAATDGDCPVITCEAVADCLAGDDCCPAGCDAGTDTDCAYHLVFVHDFEDNSAGFYDYDTWRADWRSPAWSDPRPENWTTGAKMEIMSEDGNTFMRHRIESGDFLVGASLGIQWNTPLNEAHDELYLSFRMRASSVFASQDLAGKLPGFITQRGDWSAGGRPESDEGFATMIMFGNDRSSGGYGDDAYGTGYYIYHQGMVCNSYASACCDRYPVECANWTLNCNDCPEDERVYWGEGGGIPFDFEPGRWYSFTQRLVLNSADTSNGILEVFVDGTLVASRTHYRFRDTNAVTIDSILMHNFLGGSGVSPTEDGYWDFDDVVAFYFKAEADVPHGLVASSAGRVLPLPAMR